MRGHVRRHGTGWAVVVDVARSAPCQQCQRCRRRVWLEEAPPQDVCPRCGGELVTGRGRRQKWHTGYSTKRDADRACLDLVGGLHHGGVAGPTLTLAGFVLDEWLPIKANTVRPGTLAAYQLQLRCYVLPYMGTQPLHRIDGGTLNALYRALLERGRTNRVGGLSNKTVKNVHALIHKILGDAVRWRRLDANPADQADPPGRVQSRPVVWTPEQLRRFIEHVADDPLYPAWVLAATTGMRRGEILGLRWHDIDRQRHSVTIERTLVAINNRVQLSAPKTPAGRRTVALDPFTSTLLTRAGGGEEAEGSPLVFAAPGGGPIHPQRFSLAFRSHVRAAGLPRIRFHDVRHSYATAALKAGVPIKILSQRLGHASITTTLELYAHVLDGDDEDAAITTATLILGPRPTLTTTRAKKPLRR